MGRYSPTVRPTDRNPLAEALNELRHSFTGSRQATQQRERQERLDAERGEDRDLRRQELERRMELQDLDLHDRGFRRGTAPAEMPEHEIRPMADDELSETFNALRSQGFERPQPEPAPPSPGAFVPGVGFNLRYSGAGAQTPPAEATDMQPGGMTPSPYPQPNLGERTPPRFEQVTENYYRDPSATPEAREQARQEEEFRMLREQLLAHPEVDDVEADLIAGGQMNFRDAIDPEPGRYQPTTREQWLADQEALAELRGSGGGESAMTPTESRLREQNRRQQVEQIVDDMIAAGQPTYVIDRRLNEMGYGGVIDSGAIHGRFMAAKRARRSRDLIDEGRELTNRNREAESGDAGPVSVGGTSFDRRGRSSPAPRSERQSPRREPVRAPQVDPEEAREAKGLVSHLPPEEQAAALSEAGFSDAEIRLILGDGE